MSIDNYDEMLKAFIKATEMVLDTMCAENNVTHEMLSDSSETVTGDVIGIMGLGNDVTGTAVVAFPQSLAEEIISKMSGFEIEELSKTDINDGVTEFLNMICGNAKALLTNTEFAFNLSVPTIFTSKEYRIGYHHNTIIFNMRFNLPESQFHLQVSFRKKPGETDMEHKKDEKTTTSIIG